MSNWLIVGLGNPGAEYEKTRHNLGFMLVDLLAAECQTQVKRDECRSLIGRAEIEDQTVELAKPQTFMNLSGEAVSCLLAKDGRSDRKADRDLGRSGIAVRHDPDAAAGVARRTERAEIDHRLFGNAGVHSAADRHPPEHPVANAANFVLGNFSKSETETVEKVLERCRRRSQDHCWRRNGCSDGEVECECNEIESAKI